MWYLSQLGRREHYGLPAGLQASGELGAFCTDIWAPWARHVPTWLGSARLRQRYLPELANARVHALPWWRVWRARYTGGCLYAHWEAGGRQFGRFAAEVIRGYHPGPGDVILGFTCGNLEQMQLARETGAAGLHVQIDPGLAWYETRRDVQLRHPDKEAPVPMPSGRFLERIRGEMEQAGKVVLHSAHSLESVVAHGVSRDKCVVAPPAFCPRPGGEVRRLASGRPFRVLFVGNINLCKGFHVFVEAARLLGPGFSFQAIGSIGIRPDYHREASRHVELTGHLPQARVHAAMREADLLVFPSLSDGFGLVQLEAMATGLPVVATTTCGAVVEEGRSGFLVAPEDPAAIAARITQLVRSPADYAAMSAAALRRVTDFSPEKQMALLRAAAVR